MQLLLAALGSITDTVTGESWSSNRLADEVGARADRLVALGIGPGKKVLILHGGSPKFFADLLAIWSVGGCAACANPGLTAFELTSIKEFLAPDLFVVNEQASQAAQSAGIATACLDAGLSTPSARDAGGSLDDDALILFTSGSTGTPKGVVHTFRSLLARLSLNQAWIPREERRVTLCPLPTHFGHGLIGNALTPLMDGGDLYLLPSGDLKTTLGLGEILDRYGVSFMSSVPSLWKILLKGAEPPRKKTLKRVHIGSAPLSASLWSSAIAWAGTRNVVNMYGITEAANWIGGASAGDMQPADGLVGRVWGGHAAIRDDADRIHSTGSGEILVQTPSLMRGYFNDPTLTASMLGDGWLRTGDIGQIDEAGNIRLTGRVRFEINRAGQKINPEEIDLLLDANDQVLEACTFALDDSIAGEVVAVALTPRDAATFDLSGLKSWCRERLTREKVPERWFVLEQLPKNERGKVSRLEIARACAGLRSQ
jgi:acyl-CoA synthetase (AMP-forming)/AMP-acid ligase II